MAGMRAVYMGGMLWQLMRKKRDITMIFESIGDNIWYIMHLTECSYLVLQPEYCIVGNRGTPQYYAILYCYILFNVENHDQRWHFGVGNSVLILGGILLRHLQDCYPYLSMCLDQNMAQLCRAALQGTNLNKKRHLLLLLHLQRGPKMSKLLTTCKGLCFLHNKRSLSK